MSAITMRDAVLYPTSSSSALRSKASKQTSLGRPIVTTITPRSEQGRSPTTTSPTTMRPTLRTRTSAAPVLPLSRSRAVSQSSPRDVSTDDYSDLESALFTPKSPRSKHLPSPTTPVSPHRTRKDSRSGSMSSGQPRRESVPERGGAEHSARIGGGREDSVESNVTMPEVNVVVLGASGVGKSTFIQRALGLRQAYSTLVSTRQMSVDGIVHMVRFLEVDIDRVEFRRDKSIRWPKEMDGWRVPEIDGALVLFDVMTDDTCVEIMAILDGLSRSSIPVVPVSCKCELDTQGRQVDEDRLERAKAVLGGKQSLQTAVNVADSQKRCVGAILGRVISERKATAAAAAAAEIVEQPHRRRRLHSDGSVGLASMRTGSSSAGQSQSSSKSMSASTSTSTSTGSSRRNSNSDGKSRSKTKSTTSKRSSTNSTRTGSGSGTGTGTGTGSGPGTGTGTGNANGGANGMDSSSSSTRCSTTNTNITSSGGGRSSQSLVDKKRGIGHDNGAKARPRSSSSSSSSLSDSNSTSTATNNDNEHGSTANAGPDTPDKHRVVVTPKSGEPGHPGPPEQRQQPGKLDPNSRTAAHPRKASNKAHHHRHRHSDARPAAAAVAATSTRARSTTVTTVSNSTDAGTIVSQPVPQTPPTALSTRVVSSEAAEALRSSRPSLKHTPPRPPPPSRTLSKPAADHEPEPTAAAESFLNMEDDNDDASSRASDDIPILERVEDDKSDSPPPQMGYTLQELVDRLVAQPLSKADANFAAIFLCLYRKFAAPGELLTALVRCFDGLEREETSHMIRTNAQLRHLSIMSQWVNGYPGDFAHPHTRQRLNHFIASLSQNRAFAVAVKEMRSQLDEVVEDDDGVWGRVDSESTKAMDTLTASSAHSTSSTLLAGTTGEDPASDTTRCSPDDGDGKRSTRTSGAPSNASSGLHSVSWSSGSIQTLLNTVEAAEREAQRLVPVPRFPLTKVQWHQFMESLDDDIAEELTRIDWIMYSSIRPRDLVRHVNLSAGKKDSRKSLENVNRMISHFNHMAYWVSNMILLRAKPKHRAKTLEKFMNVAWRLRYMNNYNSLGAIVAGINASAVHRLSQTRELVPHQAQKEFMRLEILMGTQKSHFAYRLAWENTSTARIPFLPLHRRDLVSAEEGNKTFIGEHGNRISWRKFEIMGDVIVGIQKSQGTPYNELARYPEVERLVLDCDVLKDDDELYERSVQLEGPSGGAPTATRKKFPWFQ